MIAALEEKALRDLLLQSAASSQEIQRSIKDAYHRQVARPQPPPLLPQPLLTSHLMMQQAAAAAGNTTRSPSITSITGTTGMRLPAVTAAAAASVPILPTSTKTKTNTNTTNTATLSSHQPQQMTRPVTNFDHYSKSAWHALNDSSLLSLSSSRQYTMAGDVYADVCDCVSAIDEMTRDDSPLGTKQNALETLREIARSVILAGDGSTVGREVRREFQADPRISGVMVRVVQGMSPEERLRTGRRADSRGQSLVSRLEWVRDEAEGHCLKDSEGFRRVLELLRSGFAASSGAGPAAAVDLTT